MKSRISVKLTAGFIIIVLFSMLVIGFLFIQMFRQYTYESKEDLLMTRAQSISEVMSEYWESNGPMRGMGGFVRFLDTMSEARVWITDMNGNPAVISGMGNEQRNMSSPLNADAMRILNEVLQGKEKVSKSFSDVYQEETLTVGVPIIGSNDRVLGAVLLHSPVTGMTDSTSDALYMLLVSILAATLLATALGIFYSLRFTKPLKVMNLTALQMANGNYAVRSGIKTCDEIGQLGNSLDLLASKLNFTIHQLFEEKSKLNNIITSISEGLFALDTNHEPVRINEALGQMMGNGKDFSHHLLKDSLVALGLIEIVQKVLSERTTEIVIKDCKNKKLKFIISPIIGNDGLAVGCVALVQDISESERLDQMRKDFIANVSHEFKTPLTVMRGSLEALTDETVRDETETRRFHVRMLAETRSMERLVKDLLDLARLQSGTLSLQAEAVDVSQLLPDAIHSMQSIADEKNIRIELSALEETPKIIGDYDRLRQLFVIFIDNAIKYSPGNTTINVGIHSGENLSVSIQDQGEGIPQQDLPFIWDRFYKGDKSRSGKDRGTGLGLAIAKHIIALHHAHVSVESRLKEGTRITVSFPISSLQVEV